MHLVLINVDYITLFQTDTSVYAGNMNSCSSTEKLRFATTHQTLKKNLNCTIVWVGQKVKVVRMVS